MSSLSRPRLDIDLYYTFTEGPTFGPETPSPPITHNTTETQHDTHHTHSRTHPHTRAQFHTPTRNWSPQIPNPQNPDSHTHTPHTPKPHTPQNTPIPDTPRAPPLLSIGFFGTNWPEGWERPPFYTISAILTPLRAFFAHFGAFWGLRGPQKVTKSPVEVT